MSYTQIEISEVGRDEYPLMQVLRDTIFGQYGHRLSETIVSGAEGKQDLIALIAHLEGNPVGYKIGYRMGATHFHSWTGGILADYRRQGVGRRMQNYQHAMLRGRGYKTVGFTTFNKFREMILFGLSSGFQPVGIELKVENEISINFRKDLTGEDGAGGEVGRKDGSGLRGRNGLEGEALGGGATGGAGEVGDVHSTIRYDDVAALARAIGEGFNISGMVQRSEPGGGLFVILDRTNPLGANPSAG